MIIYMYTRFCLNGNVVLFKDTTPTTLPSNQDKMAPVLRGIMAPVIRGISGALLADLSKSFDCLLHDLLIAKLAAYGLGYNSLVFIQSYL